MICDLARSLSSVCLLTNQLGRRNAIAIPKLSELVVMEVAKDLSFIGNQVEDTLTHEFMMNG